MEGANEVFSISPKAILRKAVFLLESRGALIVLTRWSMGLFFLGANIEAEIALIDFILMALRSIYVFFIGIDQIVVLRLH